MSTITYLRQVMNNMKRKLIAILTMACVLCAMSVPVFGAENPDASKVSNPRTEGDVVTWDCVWFGSYPQSKVNESDAVYEELEKASWDQNGDATVDGNKYRRAQDICDGEVDVDSPWGYYKYEPIKWRVLSVNGDEALLLADKSLDAKPYNETYKDVTWETSTIRSWLNGYGSSANGNGKDYSTDNFISKAFSSDEQGWIHKKTIPNPDNEKWETEGGNDTEDQIFLLSVDETMNANYGFPNHDGETTTRQTEATAYVKSQDAGGCLWLRSPGHYSYFAAGVMGNGSVSRYGGNVNLGDDAVRPALFLNLESDLWSYAETVSGNKNSKGINYIAASKEKTTYKVGETLNLNDLTVTAFCNDGSQKVVTNYTTNANEIDMMTPGKKELTVRYVEIAGAGYDYITITVEQRTVNPGPSNSDSGSVSTSSGTNTVPSNNSGTAKSVTTKPKKETLKKALSPKKGTLKLTWKKDTKATGYQAMIAMDKKFKKNKKTAWIKKNKTVTKTFIKLKSRKTYYAKVRAYKKVGKKNVYGAYSKVKKARVK